jgi:hypothetical protein
MRHAVCTIVRFSEREAQMLLDPFAYRSSAGADVGGLSLKGVILPEDQER